MYKETFPRPIITQNVYCYCSSSDVRKCFNFCCCDKFQSKVTEYEVRWEVIHASCMYKLSVLGYSVPKFMSTSSGFLN